MDDRKNCSRSCLIRAVFTVFALAAALTPIAVFAQTADEQPALEKQAFNPIRKGNCAEAWKIVWHEARQGNSEALASLADRLVPLGILVPPSYFPMRENIVQNFEDQVTALRLYAWKDAGVSNALKDHGLGVDQIIPRHFWDNKVIGDYRRVDACLKSNKNTGDCVQLAIKLKIIPPFDVYVSMMDAAPRQAFCIALTEKPKGTPHSVPLQSQQR
ncbi:hypothetical protein HJC05_09105 [Rhizobium sp. NLR9a]|uniref:hypothetical protein n=1 Tax=Rhizobium sp. NLR9a TaxID=2731120 RepID=UPI001C834289|nr:hypothetical protein [Rhizobium sp. NLR9a]MBX5214362.1 hypothetical protein [Rhizobium sp. NLR9a]